MAYRVSRILFTWVALWLLSVSSVAVTETKVQGDYLTADDTILDLRQWVHRVGSGSVWLCADLGTLACQRERHEATGSQRHCGTDAQKCWSLPTPGRDRARRHILRHTFCSHLAMKDAPTRAFSGTGGPAQIKVGHETGVQWGLMQTSEQAEASEPPERTERSEQRRASGVE